MTHLDLNIESKRFDKEYENLSCQDKLDFVRKSIKECSRCFRRFEVASPVPPWGSVEAEVLIWGACPGEKEVRDEIPFNPIAPGGKLLSKYLYLLGIKRDQCYITNVCHCYAKGDRLPTGYESNICKAWKIRELEYLKKLKYVLILGNNAVQQAFGSSLPSMVYVSGSVIDTEWKGNKLKVLLIHHPGYVLRKGNMVMKKVYEDLLRFREEHLSL